MESALLKIQKLADGNLRYQFEAYRFLLSALHDTMKKINPPRHITGGEFCEGILNYAVAQFGPMARAVLEYWGIKNTLDFGHIVFELVEVGLMRKTEEDSLNDFKDIYDFDTAFSKKTFFG